MYFSSPLFMRTDNTDSITLIKILAAMNTTETPYIINKVYFYILQKKYIL